MCGITGIYNLDGSFVEQSLIQQINNTLIHRGPDAGATFQEQNIALGHRRLSIIDLSEEANQPMYSDDDRFIIVFNGEVYNFLNLRKTLESKEVVFRTNSDTEVVLKAFIYYGDKAFSMLNGMFAFSIYDRKTKELVIVRDRFGVKPLVYYVDENKIIFSSEKKAILAHPEANLTLNKQALVEYMWYGNPLGANTFYTEIEELKPGSYLKIKNGVLTKGQYFDIHAIKEIKVSEEQAIEKIRELLENSIKRHLISDVPVGVFLSGGIDSSAITGYASKHYSGKLKTYSVAFDFNKGPNELSKAAAVAQEFNTQHNEVYISGTDTIDTILKLVDSHDEPFGDAADIPLYLLTKELKGDIKVVLQGDGGDEFFGGYSRYKTVYKLKKYKLLSLLNFIFKKLPIQNTAYLRLRRFIEAISVKNRALRNAYLMTMESKSSNPLRVLDNSLVNELKHLNPFKKYQEVYQKLQDKDDLQVLFYTDPQIILSDTFFEKVDKSTMANSMEVRVPFIDNDLTNYLLSLPSKLKVKDGIQKYILKRALEGIVPNDILYGPKTGFSVPYDYWLKTSLRAFFKEQINTEKAGKLINRKEVNHMFELHLNDKGNFGFLLWKTLILAIWLNKTSVDLN